MIFEFARRARWSELDGARNLVIEKNLGRERHRSRSEQAVQGAPQPPRRRNPENQLHMTDPYNWRETAALLGLYWAFAPQ